MACASDGNASLEVPDGYPVKVPHGLNPDLSDLDLSSILKADASHFSVTVPSELDVADANLPLNLVWIRGAFAAESPLLISASSTVPEKLPRSSNEMVVKALPSPAIV